MVEAVIFNMDGTLIQRNRSYDEIYEEAIEKSGIDELKNKYSDYQEAFFRFFKQNYVFPRRQAAEFLLKKEGVFRDDKVERFVEAWEEAESDSFVLKEGLEEVIENLKQDGYLLGVTSNGTGELQRMKLEKLGIKDFFDSIIIASEVGYSKPEEEFFKEVKNSLPNAERFFMVSHLPKTDIIGGKRAGLKPIWINESRTEESIGDADIINDLRDLPQKLRDI